MWNILAILCVIPFGYALHYILTSSAIENLTSGRRDICSCDRMWITVYLDIVSGVVQYPNM